MNSFVKGFLKRANQHGLGDDVLRQLSDFFKYHPSGESLYSLSDSATSTNEEIGNISKHLGGSVFSGAGKGAAAGGVLGLLGGLGSSHPLKKILSGASKGAVLGGALEGGREAYELGNNTRSATLQPFENELNSNPSLSKEEKETLRHNVEVMKSSPWFEYYYPPRVFQKLK